MHEFWFADWGFDWRYDQLFVQPVLWFARVDRNDVVDAFYNGVADLKALMDRSLSRRKMASCAGTPRGLRWNRRICRDRVVPMILLWLIVILFVGGLPAWVAGRRSALAARWISLAAVAGLWHRPLWSGCGRQSRRVLQQQPGSRVELDLDSQFGVHFHLAMDGLSLLLLMLTFFLGVTSVLASWTEIRKQWGSSTSTCSGSWRESRACFWRWTCSCFISPGN